MTDFSYVGSELELFATASKWKSYWSRLVRPFVTGDVIEVGAGIGSNTPFLDSGSNKRWVCLEPDPVLLFRLGESLKQTSNGRRYETACSTLQNFDPHQQFDTIIYIDVLEHIENDREELKIAASRLRLGGRIIVLTAAHQCLFTPFDTAVGHFRRYNTLTLRRLSPVGLTVERLRYLDSVGLTASAANLLFLRQSMPSPRQLHFWDNWLVPVSRILDKVFLNSVGKSILGVWRRTPK